MATQRGFGWMFVYFVTALKNSSFPQAVGLRLDNLFNSALFFIPFCIFSVSIIIQSAFIDPIVWLGDLSAGGQQRSSIN